MKKSIIISSLVFFLVLVLYSFSYAVIKPESGTDVDSLSYIFYLYYDNGKIFADRDYEVKYDIVNETYTPEPTTAPNLYKLDIVNYKYEIAKSFQFDPKRGNPSFDTGKIMVKASYVPDGLRANFYDNNGNQLVNVFVNTGSVCNDDNLCDTASGETEKNCSNDCKAKTTPRVTTTPGLTVVEEDYDLNTILIYIVAGAGVGVGAWFGWGWLKKRREGNFPLPPSSVSSPQPPMPPVTPPSQ